PAPLAPARLPPTAARGEEAPERRFAASPASRAHLFQHLARPVHALVVRAELALLDRPPPRLVLHKPPHRLTYAILERDRRRPSCEPRELRRVDRVAAIVSGPILDVPHQRL